jgi:hypothetical protein
MKHIVNHVQVIPAIGVMMINLSVLIQATFANNAAIHITSMVFSLVKFLAALWGQ